MNVMDAIRTRKSVRRYLDRPVEAEKLRAVLEAGRLAPSASNRQEWRFVVVQDSVTREKLGEAAGHQAFVGEAPAVIVACAETDGHVMRGGLPCFPIDVAIVQIVIETITLIIMVSVVLASTRHEIREDPDPSVKSTLKYQVWGNLALVMLIVLVLFFSFRLAIVHLDAFGDHSLRMSQAYLEGAAERTGSANLVTGVLFDFRGYDTFGEATILFTAVIGVLTVLRIKGKK